MHALTPTCVLRIYHTLKTANMSLCCIFTTHLRRLICPEGHVSSLNKFNPIREHVFQIYTMHKREPGFPTKWIDYEMLLSACRYLLVINPIILTYAKHCVVLLNNEFLMLINPYWFESTTEPLSEMYI